MRIAWLAPLDLRQVAHRLDEPLRGRFHNSPWITNGMRALAESGAVDLHVVSYDKRLRRDCSFVDRGVTFHLIRARMPRVPRGAVLYRLDRRPFMRLLADLRPDVVHGHGTENLFSYMAVTSPFPSVISMQAVMCELTRAHRSFSLTWCAQMVARSVERRTLRRASRVFVEAPFVEAILRRINPKLAIRLAGNIVSDPFFAVCREPGPAPKKIMFVGSLIETKGVEEVVRAFHRIAALLPHAELHLVGEGPPRYVRSRLQPLVDGGPGAGRIRMRGHLSFPAIAAEYRDAAAVVLPSRYDTSPNAIAEAMVGGVPVVATRVGGLPYMLQDGAAGALLDPGDLDALAGAMRFVFEHPDIAGERAARAQRVARRRYGKELFVRRMLDTYREVAAGDPPDPGAVLGDDDVDG